MADTPEGKAPGNEGAITPKEVILKPGQVVVEQSVLTKILQDQASLEKRITDEEANRKGLEELFAANNSEEVVGGNKLRLKKNFEPAFRTVRIRKYPMGGDPEKLGYVIGWSDRGAYHKVDRSGVNPQVVDYIDVFFLGHERNEEGKLQAESVPLLKLLNDSTQVHCKIIEVKKVPRIVPTGEEINVTTWDPQHGLIQTGDIIDGYIGFTDMTLVVQIPGVEGTTEIDEKYVN